MAPPKPALKDISIQVTLSPPEDTIRKALGYEKAPELQSNSSNNQRTYIKPLEATKNEIHNKEHFSKTPSTIDTIKKNDLNNNSIEIENIKINARTHPVLHTTKLANDNDEGGVVCSIALGERQVEGAMLAKGAGAAAEMNSTQEAGNVGCPASLVEDTTGMIGNLTMAVSFITLSENSNNNASDEEKDQEYNDSEFGRDNVGSVVKSSFASSTQEKGKVSKNVSMKNSSQVSESSKSNDASKASKKKKMGEINILNTESKLYNPDQMRRIGNFMGMHKKNYLQKIATGHLENKETIPANCVTPACAMAREFPSMFMIKKRGQQPHFAGWDLPPDPALAAGTDKRATRAGGPLSYGAWSWEVPKVARKKKPKKYNPFDDPALHGFEYVSKTSDDRSLDGWSEDSFSSSVKHDKEKRQFYVKIPRHLTNQYCKARKPFTPCPRETAQAYLTRHAIHNIFQMLLASVWARRPAEPLDYMLAVLAAWREQRGKQSEAERAGPAVRCPPPPPPPPSTPPPARLPMYMATFF